MKAMIIRNPGESGQLEQAILPVPAPEAGEVLVRVRYAGINRADLFQLQGKYPQPDGQHAIPGLEISGEVEKVGEDVTDFEPGMRVCGLISEGGYAEYVCVPAGQLAKLPEKVSTEQGACLPEVYATTWLALKSKANLRKGERVLIHGGASGVGMAAVKLARFLEATPIITASTAEKCAACTAVGAAQVIAYKEQDFAEVLKDAPVDVVLDIVGGEYLAKNLSVLGRKGRLVALAFLGGAVSTANMAPMLLKELSVYGVTLRSQPGEIKAELMRILEQTLMAGVQTGALAIPVDKVFPLDQAQKALKHMENNLNVGKILLDCAG